MKKVRLNDVQMDVDVQTDVGFIGQTSQTEVIEVSSEDKDVQTDVSFVGKPTQTAVDTETKDVQTHIPTETKDVQTAIPTETKEVQMAIPTETKEVQTELQNTNILTVDKIELVTDLTTQGSQTDALELASLQPIIPAEMLASPEHTLSDVESTLSSASKHDDTGKKQLAGIDMRRGEYREVEFPPVKSTQVPQKPMDVKQKEHTPSPVDLCTKTSEKKTKIKKTVKQVTAPCMVSEDPREVLRHVTKPQTRDEHLTPAHHSSKQFYSSHKSTSLRPEAIKPAKELHAPDPAADLSVKTARLSMGGDAEETSREVNAEEGYKIFSNLMKCSHESDSYDEIFPKRARSNLMFRGLDESRSGSTFGFSTGFNFSARSSYSTMTSTPMATRQRTRSETLIESSGVPKQSALSSLNTKDEDNSRRNLGLTIKRSESRFTGGFPNKKTKILSSSSDGPSQRNLFDRMSSQGTSEDKIVEIDMTNNSDAEDSIKNAKMVGKKFFPDL